LISNKDELNENTEMMGNNNMFGGVGLGGGLGGAMFGGTNPFQNLAQ
jgi:hypothetical protein